jgi:hypothetical protein
MKALKALWDDLEAGEIAVIIAALGCAALVVYTLLA